MKSQKALLIRIDRIGDLVLTLPVQSALQNEGYVCEWLFNEGLGFVADVANEPVEYLEVQRRFSFLQLRALYRRVRAFRPDVAIVFHAPWWMSFLLWLARVPRRAGVRSQWHSFLFFNRALRQKRSEALHSELEYNFQMAEHAVQKKLIRSTLKLSVNSKVALDQNGISPGHYHVVHVGMGGSALNWPMEYYANLIQRLIGSTPVVLTGTKIDAPYLNQLKTLLPSSDQIRWLNEKLTSHELMQVLAHAKSVIAPSTGVVHLAASLGVQTIGLYSPVRVQSIRRWGPQGVKARALSPEPIDCPGEMKCIGPTCAHFNCMSRITVDSVLNQLP